MFGFTYCSPRLFDMVRADIRREQVQRLYKDTLSEEPPQISWLCSPDAFSNHHIDWSDHLQYRGN